MLLIKEPDVEPIPGYRLLEPLGRGGFGEVWKCEAPGGLIKAIKFVAGPMDDLDTASVPAAEELKAIQLIKSLRHPFLLSMERVEWVGTELVIVTELADKSLLDLYHECRKAGQTGIDRQELLGYLHEAAGVLDLMNQRHGLQHLDIKPGNLLLVSDHLKVADFGLVRSMNQGGDGQPLALGALTALYAAPELYQNGISPTCDQYSLAVVYQELLTGKLPFTGKNARQLMLAHCTAVPDLSPLPVEDQAVVGRAMSKQPAARFPTCMDFIRALQTGFASPATGAEDTPPRGASPLTYRHARDTRTDSSHGTLPLRPANPQVLPGYQFHICRERTPFVEVWEVQSPEGEHRLAKFLYGLGSRGPGREEAVRSLESLQHPALPAVRILPAGPGALVALSERPGDSLRDRYQAHRGSLSGEALPGLPRRQLLGWLRQAATALDELRQQTGLQHLGLTPRHLLVSDDSVRLADFGLLPLLWRPAGQLSPHLQSRYAAPELFQDEISSACDSYSLAVIFQEMLTGAPPWRSRRVCPPDFDALTEADRQVMERALSATPNQRCTSCRDLVEALEEAGSGRRLLAGAGSAGDSPTASAVLVAELLVESGGGRALAQPEMWNSTPRGTALLQSRFTARLPDSHGAAMFEVFRRQWHAQVVHEGAGKAAFHIPLPGRFWQRWLGGSPGLLVDLQWDNQGGQQHAELRVHISAWEKGRTDDALVQEVAPVVLEGLRQHFEAFAERRGRKRLTWPHPVRAACMQADGSWSEPIAGEGKDISLTGMGVYLPRVLPAPSVRLELTVPTRPELVVLPGRCIRLHRCAADRYLVGIAFSDEGPAG